jgi:hypothetical protein
VGAVKEVDIARGRGSREAASFAACLATVLELPLDALPKPGPDEHPAVGWTTSRWLGGLGLGIVPISEPRGFSWPGPWIAHVFPPESDPRYVVMFGVPSGPVWDPGANGGLERRGGAFASDWIEAGFVVAATDIALALPAPAASPASTGSIEGIFVAPSAAEPTQSLATTRALAGRGLEGDRHTVGRGTFPSGLPGSALTLIEAEVCESFDPPLLADEHRRNVVTRGIDLNGLAGHEFVIGELRCRGMRLCEPCTVVDGYASQPVLRALVHRGGLRADILEDGQLSVGEVIRAVG